MNPRLLIMALLAVAGAAGILLHKHRSQPTPGFVGTLQCAGCHQQAFADWQLSDHRRAMEAPDSQTVLGDFNNALFEHHGVTSRFFTRDDGYFVETDNARGEAETFRIAYTFGHYPLQQYLIAFPDGRMQALGVSWDSRPKEEGGQRWYHLHAHEQVAHDDPLHWTGAFQNWNSRCATCHSTNLQKNYSQQTDRYETRWQEVNIGCEACHGPGSQHVAWAGGRRSLPHKGLLVDVAGTWAPASGGTPPSPGVEAPMTGQLQVCSTCHSRRAEIAQPDPAGSFFDHFTLSPLLADRYHDDGQIRDEVYETGSFLQSRMHMNQVTCSNCHEPHSSRLRMTGNALCLQCHAAPTYQTRDHFFHEPESPGAQCVNCHMPQQTYMGIDARRDHSFRIPDPIASVKLGVPNACTQCHKDRDDRWAAAFITRRTGRNEPHYVHAEILAAARAGTTSVVPRLLAYARDPRHPAMLRSIALLESGRFPSAQQIEAVGSSMQSPDPLVRMGAASALASVDPARRLTLLKPLLQDPLRSVRLVAARELIDVPLSQAPPEMREALRRLFAEYRQSLEYNADMPESMSDLGLFHAAQGDAQAAEQALLHARRLAPRYLPAMLNLADLHRARNRDDQAEPLLREALAAYPESADVHHTLGLLQVRTGRLQQSVALLRRAAELAPGNAQYALVHALSLIETGQRARGIAVLTQASRRFPDDAQIRQALEGYGSRTPN